MTDVPSTIIGSGAIGTVGAYLARAGVRFVDASEIEVAPAR